VSLAERYGRFLASRPHQVEAGRDRRRDAAIIFYAGRNGSGKSLSAVFDCLPDLDAGRTVLSTVRLLDYKNPRPCEDRWCSCDKSNPERHLHAHPSYERWTTWPQLLKLRDGVALADEVTGVADSSVQNLPPLVVDELAQLRRADVVLRLTGLNYVRAHKRIREATQAVVQCSGSFPVDAFHEDGRPRLHRRRRLVEWVTYDAEDIPIENPTEAAFESADELGRSRVWVPDSEARTAYDTFDSVSRIGTVSDAGRCPHCEGTRRAVECDCPDYVGRKSGRSTARRRASGEHGAPADLPTPSTMLTHLHEGPSPVGDGLAG
jgi:hypothetical protein